jgi:biotin carboxyl carrier protein
VPDAKRDGREPQGRKPENGTAAGRLADHAEIGRLTDVLLPALIAKLATTRLGELEVREGDWRVRLRRPAAPDLNYGRRATDKPSRSQPGHEGHGHARGAPESATTRTTRLTGVGPGDPTGAAAPTTNGTGVVRAALAAARLAEHDRNVAYSPAVGVFHPGSRAAAGTRVRSGDALGSVDVLGVPQEVLAPADGIVATTLVEGGTAVEYGQELVRLELTTPAESR